MQPSTYGTDNRCTVDAIAALGPDNTRGVAIVDDTVDPAILQDLTDRGIRGARFHMLAGAPIPWERLDRIAARVQEVGWHVQLQLDGRDLPEREAQVRSWPGRIVIDHVGKFLEPVPPEHPAFGCLLGLIDTGRVWVKLSGAYEVSKHGAPLYDDVGRLAKALVKAAPERMFVGQQLAAPVRAGQAGRRDFARRPARLGARRSEAPAHPGRQPGRVLRVLTTITMRRPALSP